MGEIFMEKIREMQLELVKMIEAVDNVFKENGIQYFLVGGSVLGAIRHKGFIPWDDDMDIGIKRNQFERAEELLASLKDYVYEPSDKHIIPDAPLGHLHLVNEVYPIENSPTLDVFALDGVPGNKQSWKKVKSLANWYHLAVLGRPAQNRGKLVKCATWLLLSVIPKNIWQKIKNFTFQKLTSLDVSTAECIANIWGAWGYKEFYPREMFDGSVDGEFEGLKLPLPANPDEYLTQMYGDYMTLPPVENRVPRHRTF